MKVVVLSSLSWSLINFRGALIARMIARGHEVLACAPDAEPEVIAKLSAMGADFRLTPMARAGTNPFRDLALLARYLRLLRRERPGAVIAYTQKPIIYGGLATRLLGVPFHAIMSGLGYVYSEEATARRGLRRLVSLLYRAGVRRARTIFVFNGDDRRDMIDFGLVAPDQPVLQVPGSGVDVKHFAQQPLPEGPPTFLMMGRLMRDKGVFEYVAAARILRARRPDARFLLLGRPETENPTGCTAEELRAWQDDSLIELLPETRDVRPVLASAHVFVLPSFYREGLPRTILEALATGRPVVTTDMPGCREPIVPGVNGFLVPPRNAQALADAMAVLFEDPARIGRMAQSAREVAVTRYDVDLVNATLLDAMDLAASGDEPGAIAPRTTPQPVPA